MKLLDLPIQRIYYPVGEYMDESINYIDEVVKLLINSKHHKRADINIFCMGSSGAILSSLLYSKIHTYCNIINIIHIKKSGETSHCGRIREYNPKYTNIIIDDFTESGNTLKQIIAAIFSFPYNTTIDYLIMSDIDGNTFPIVQKLNPKYVINREWSNSHFNLWLNNNPINIEEIQQDIPL
jgi:hypothetical protein